MGKESPADPGQGPLAETSRRTPASPLKPPPRPLPAQAAALTAQFPRRSERLTRGPPSLVAGCPAMTTAWYRPTWDLALDPLVSCKLCLGEYPLEQMTTLAQCRCTFCTLVGASGGDGRGPPRTPDEPLLSCSQTPSQPGPPPSQVAGPPSQAFPRPLEGPLGHTPAPLPHPGQNAAAGREAWPGRPGPLSLRGKAGLVFPGRPAHTGTLPEQSRLVPGVRTFWRRRRVALSQTRCLSCAPARACGATWRDAWARRRPLGARRRQCSPRV